MNLQLELIPEPQPNKTNPFLELRLKHIVDGVPCSQRKLSKLMKKKVSHGHISSLENGKRPSMTELECYHDYFGVSYEYLLNKIETPSIKHDSFYQMVQWLSNSRNQDEKNMWKCFLEITTSESGLVLLYYITEFLTAESISEEKFMEALRIWRSIPNKDFLTYQELRNKIDNYIKK